VLCSIVCLELNGPWAGEIKRHREVETLLVARDNSNEAVKEILDWLMEGIDSGPRSLPLNTTLYSQID
jgi:hypothetical protein